MPERQLRPGGDSGGQQRLIKTHLRKGIRFVGAVREEERPASRRAEQPTSELALPDRPSIAVLPFTNFSGDRDEVYVADGIVEGIITELSRFGELLVIARQSSFQYRRKTVDVRRVSRETGIRYLASG